MGKQPEPYELKVLAVRNGHLGSRQLSLAVPASWLRNQFSESPGGEADGEVGKISVSVSPTGDLVLSRKRES